MQPNDQQPTPPPQEVSPQEVPPQAEQPVEEPPVAQTPSEPPEVPVSPTPPTEPEIPEQAPEPAVDAQPQPQVVEDFPEQDESSSEEPQGPTSLPDIEPIRWQAAEYIQHDKTPIWYVGFIVAIIVLMVAAILLMHTWTFAILIPVMAAALMVYSHRPPRQLTYALSDKGLYINDQLHAMGEFKNFGVLQDVQLHALMMIPIKRFRPALTVYFPTEVGERIVDLLGGYLPMQELHLDVFDKIVRKLRI